MLCARLTLKGRYLEPSIIADMFCFLVTFGCDIHNISIQVYLSLVLHCVNELALDQIVMVASHLSELTTVDDSARSCDDASNASNVNTFGDISSYIAMSNLSNYEKARKQSVLLKEAIRVLCQLRGDQIEMLSTSSKIILLDLFGAELSYSKRLMSMIERDREDIDNVEDATTLLRVLSCLPLLLVSNATTRRLKRRCADIIVDNVDALTNAKLTSIRTYCIKLNEYRSKLFVSQSHLLPFTDQQEQTGKMSVISQITKQLPSWVD